MIPLFKFVISAGADTHSVAKHDHSNSNLKKKITYFTLILFVDLPFAPFTFTLTMKITKQITLFELGTSKLCPLSVCLDSLDKQWVLFDV